MESAGSVGADSRSRFRKETEFRPGSARITMSGEAAAAATATVSKAGFPRCSRRCRPARSAAGRRSARASPPVPGSTGSRPRRTRTADLPVRQERADHLRPLGEGISHPEDVPVPACSSRTLSVISAVAATGTRSTVRCAAAISSPPRSPPKGTRPRVRRPSPGNQPQRLRLRHVYSPLRVADDDRHPLPGNAPSALA